MDFKKFLIQQGAEEGLQRVFLALAGAFPEVARMLAGRAEGNAGTKNVFGESQLKMDVATNNLFLEILKKSPDVASIASEEMELEEKGGGDAYSVAYDPLDGSSLVDVNLAVGSIFGVYPGAGFIGRTGLEQSAAIIAVYGPRLTFMVTIGKGVFEFLYDEAEGVFECTGEIKMNGEKKIFAPGNLRACASEKWYLDLLGYWVKNGYTLRYSGGMVPDVNQILKKGNGVFTYPGYAEKPEGKLRLLYECAPMAFLMEQAGGVAVAGKGRVLDLKIEKLDQRTPVFLGAKNEIDLVRSYMEKSSG